MMSDSLLKRKALAMISPERRKVWAREHPLQTDCSTCLKYRKISRTCFYPSHFWGPRLDAAFQELCGGKLSTETAIADTDTANANAETSTAIETETETDGDLDRDMIERSESSAGTVGTFGKDAAGNLAEALRVAMRANTPTIDANAVKAIVKDMIKGIQPGVNRMEITVVTKGIARTLGYAYLDKEMGCHDGAWLKGLAPIRNRGGDLETYISTVRKCLNAGPEDIIIGPVYLADDTIKNPIKFVQSMIDKHTGGENENDR